ncbi:hypothetical protein MAM1_0222c08282 [Mucor ambiguus]|uniref:Integral membrane protein n=1 Tax=Mucor ambiguus TaxID=91626 RepID=A0A0C9MDQ8_9FUNG|nr:hypothetical protein MAM1_0222c08282 [Mucor ambiguus]
MISTVAVLYITTVALEAVLSVFIATKTFFQPKKVRYVMLVFSLITLAASIVNTLSYLNLITSHWNSFAYLISTLFMLALHYWLNLDIGKYLRVGGIDWKHPLVLAGAAGLGGSMACLTTQLIILLIRNDPYPIRAAFITGVCLAIACDSAAYTYSFSSLIYLKRQLHEGQAKTTSLGVWFLLIQSTWYILYGVLYIWFFLQTWEYFQVLLVLDYLARFILCLMFTWAPPNFVITFMTSRLFSDLSHKSITLNDKADYHTQTQGKVQEDDIETNNRNDMFYASHVAIVSSK